MHNKTSSRPNVENRMENASRDWPSRAQPPGTWRGTAGKDLLDLSRLSWMDFGLRTPRQGLSNEAKALEQEWENSSRWKVWKTGMCLRWVLLLKAAGTGLLPPILLPSKVFCFPLGPLSVFSTHTELDSSFQAQSRASLPSGAASGTARPRTGK